LALQGPSQTTEIDANRSAVFRNGLKKKKETKAQPNLFAFVRTSKFEGFTGIEPLTFDVFSTFDSRANDLVTG
jgi:hypothetical protein